MSQPLLLTIHCCWRSLGKGYILVTFYVPGCLTSLLGTISFSPLIQHIHPPRSTCSQELRALGLRRASCNYRREPPLHSNINAADLKSTVSYHSSGRSGTATMTSKSPPPQQGSSTGAPGIPGSQNMRSRYDPERTKYNPATGSGYSPTRETNTGSAGYAASEGSAGEKSVGASTAEGAGKGLRAAAAGLHGLGESIRGALNAATDRAFGHDESAARNEEVARRGEEEMRTGRLHTDSRATK